jgi:hypothetical protein
VAFHQDSVAALGDGSATERTLEGVVLAEASKHDVDGALQLLRIVACDDVGENATSGGKEYEAVRSVPVRFAIALNHENPEVDVLVSESSRYAVVDKAYGPPARIALETDPRKH